MAELEEGPSPILNTVNLGDSGYLVFRPENDLHMETQFKSESQQHYFNCPYQTGKGYKWPTEAQVNKHEVDD